jgi:phosphotransacetylase
MTKTLNLDADTSFLRGIEMADDNLFEHCVAALREMRKQNTYSNQDVDKRLTARHYLTAMRAIGNIPLRTLADA